MLTIGQTIPAIDVEALTPHGDYRIINLGEHRSRWKVLFFWQWDFTFTCLMNIRAYHDLVRQFTESDAILLGASVDSVYAHRAWTTNGLGKIGFPLIGDATRQLARRFGVLSGKEGMAEYATFIIDPSGQVAGISTNPTNVSHSALEALHMLRMIQTGKVAGHDPSSSLPYGSVA